MGPTENEAVLQRAFGRIRVLFPRHQSKKKHPAQALFCTWLKQTKSSTASATRYEVTTLKVLASVYSNLK